MAPISKNSFWEALIFLLVDLSCNYLKKARGGLQAVAHCEITEFQTDTHYAVKAEIKNHDQEVVAVVNTVWRLRFLS